MAAQDPTEPKETIKTVLTRNRDVDRDLPINFPLNRYFSDLQKNQHLSSKTVLKFQIELNLMGLKYILGVTS